MVLLENYTDKVTIELLNLQGQIIRKVVEYPAEHKVLVDLSEFESGVYVMKITTSKNTVEKKIIIDK